MEDGEFGEDNWPTRAMLNPTELTAVLEIRHKQYTMTHQTRLTDNGYTDLLG